MQKAQRPDRSAELRFQLGRKIVPALLLAAAVLLGTAIAVDAQGLVSAIGSLDPLYLALALALSSSNFAIRFLRWQLYLRTLEVEAPLKVSAYVFFSGLAMSITPGKLGELVKCVLLQQRTGARPARTAPVIIAERVVDLVAVMLLASFGIVVFPGTWPLFAVGLVVTGALLLTLGFSPRAVDRIGSLLGEKFLKGRLFEWATESSSAFRDLLAGRTLVLGVILGLLAWFAECVAFFALLIGLGLSVSLLEATSIYAVASLAGAISMLPGGLGATEASMTGMLSALMVPLSLAAAATILIRAATLWWAVLVGVVFYMTHLTDMRRALLEIAPDDR